MIFGKKKSVPKKISGSIGTVFPRQIPVTRYDGDFAVFESAKVAVKVWLPEPIDQILRELAEYFALSRTELIKQTLFIYVYGRYRFEQMRLQKEGFFRPQTMLSRSGAMFSRSGDRTKNPLRKLSNKEQEELKRQVEEKVEANDWDGDEPVTQQSLGKNFLNYKVWMPTLLRDDAARLADHAGIKLSHFIREVLISTYMGHLRLPERDEMLRGLPETDGG
ncbi:MAG: hypothetical protein Q8M53_15355 [Burkholderiales bacterium]|nr:hypothetical protein [Burkholderiales bacterium]